MNNVEIYLDPLCPYCSAAVSILSEENIEFSVINLAQEPERYPEMLARAQRRTVPQIFIGDTHLGGCDDLIEARNNSLLAELLHRQVPAQSA